MFSLFDGTVQGPHVIVLFSSKTRYAPSIVGDLCRPRYFLGFRADAALHVTPSFVIPLKASPFAVGTSGENEALFRDFSFFIFRDLESSGSLNDFS